MKLEDEIKYKLDAGQTLLANMFWIFICFVAIAFFIIGFNQVALFENEMNQLLGIIIISLATVKIFNWNGHPRLYLKERVVK